MRSEWFLGLLTVALVTGACNEVTTGKTGVLTFTPDECGEVSCSLDDDLAVGGSILVSIDERRAGGDLSDLTLITDAAGVLRVESVTRTALTSEWRVTALAPGPARLIAIDRQGYEVDYTDVGASSADKLRIEHRAGNAVGPGARTGFDEVWTVKAGESIDLRIAPFHGNQRLTGRIAYHVDIDKLLHAGLSPGSSLERGELAFRVPAGEYDATFDLPDGQALRLLVVAQ
jgi:hypothetical protein